MSLLRRRLNIAEDLNTHSWCEERVWGRLVSHRAHVTHFSCAQTSGRISQSSLWPRHLSPFQKITLIFFERAIRGAKLLGDRLSILVSWRRKISKCSKILDSGEYCVLRIPLDVCTLDQRPRQWKFITLCIDAEGSTSLSSNKRKDR